MNKNNFDPDSLGGRQLADEELMQIQGGGWLSDAWNAVKKAIYDFTHPKPFPLPWPPTIPRPQLPPGLPPQLPPPLPPGQF